MAQDSTRTLTERYRMHLAEADRYERLANASMDKVREFYGRQNPNASIEWIDNQVSAHHKVKKYIATQQFHARQATMCGPGAIMEVLAGLVAEIRAFGHRP